MASSRAAHRPIWLDELDMPEPPPLEADTEADTCIVGAGMAGLSVAYELTLRGRSVVVLDKAPVASAETSRSIGQLCVALDNRYFDIERWHGVEGARIAAESHAAAIDRVERIALAESIDCGFRRVDGYLFAAPDQPRELIEREFEAIRQAGIEDVEIVPCAPIATFDTGRALRFPHQAQMNVARYGAGLARAIMARGGRIHCGMQAVTIEGGSEAIVQTAQGPLVRGGQVVVATHTPINNLVSVHTKQAARRSYMVAAPIPKGSLQSALYWDMAHPYHYIRVVEGRSDVDHIVLGGEDHRTGQNEHSEEKWGLLESWLHVRLPMAGPVALHWSGQIMQSADGLALIGCRQRIRRHRRLGLAYHPRRDSWDHPRRPRHRHGESMGQAV
jgi:glycine/D-amino acid oxidase-like deaminating enzyme